MRQTLHIGDISSLLSSLSLSLPLLTGKYHKTDDMRMEPSEGKDTERRLVPSKLDVMSTVLHFLSGTKP